MSQPVEPMDPLAARDPAPEVTHAAAPDVIGRQVWTRYADRSGVIAHRRTHSLIQRLLHWSTTADGWPAPPQTSAPGYASPALVFRQARGHDAQTTPPADLGTYANQPDLAGNPLQLPKATQTVQARRLTAPQSPQFDRPSTMAAARPVGATAVQRAALTATQGQPVQHAQAVSTGGSESSGQRMGATIVQRYSSTGLHKPISPVHAGAVSRLPLKGSGASAATRRSTAGIAPSSTQLATGSPTVSPTVSPTASPTAVARSSATTPSDPLDLRTPVRTTPAIRLTPPRPDGAASASTLPGSFPGAQPVRTGQDGGTSAAMGANVLQRYLHAAVHRPTTAQTLDSTTHLSTAAAAMVQSARMASGDSGTAMPLVVSARRIETQPAPSTAAQTVSAPSTAAIQPSALAAPVVKSDLPALGVGSTSVGTVLRSANAAPDRASIHSADEGGHGRRVVSQTGQLTQAKPVAHTNAATAPLRSVVKRAWVDPDNDSPAAPVTTPVTTPLPSVGPSVSETGGQAITAGALGAGIYRRHLETGGVQRSTSISRHLPALQAQSHSGGGAQPLLVAAVRLPARSAVTGSDEPSSTASASMLSGVTSSTPVVSPVSVPRVAQPTAAGQSGQLGFKLQAQYVEQPTAHQFHPTVQAKPAPSQSAAPVVVMGSYVSESASPHPAPETGRNPQPPPLVARGYAPQTADPAQTGSSVVAAPRGRSAPGVTAVQRSTQRTSPTGEAEHLPSRPVVQSVAPRRDNPADVILAGGPFRRTQGVGGTVDLSTLSRSVLTDSLSLAQLDREGGAQPAGSGMASPTLAPSLGLPIRQPVRSSTAPAATATSVVLQRAEALDSQPPSSALSTTSGTSAELADADFAASDVDEAQLQRMADKVYRMIEQRLIVERESMGL